MACLIILRRSRVGHPMMASRYVVTVRRRWSFFDKSGCTVLYLFKMFNLGSGVWIPYRRDIFKFWSDNRVIGSFF